MRSPVEADGVVLLVVGAGDRDGLGVDPGVELDERVHVAHYGASVAAIWAVYLLRTTRSFSACRALTCAAESEAMAAVRAFIIIL